MTRPWSLTKWILPLIFSLGTSSSFLINHLSFLFLYWLILENILLLCSGHLWRVSIELWYWLVLWILRLRHDWLRLGNFILHRNLSLLLQIFNPWIRINCFGMSSWLIHWRLLYLFLFLFLFLLSFFPIYSLLVKVFIFLVEVFHLRMAKIESCPIDNTLNGINLIHNYKIRITMIVVNRFTYLL